MGKQAPSATTGKDVEDGVNNLTDIDRARTTTSFMCWNEWFEDVPLPFAEVCRIKFSSHHTCNLNTQKFDSILSKHPLRAQL